MASENDTPLTDAQSALAATCWPLARREAGRAARGTGADFEGVLDEAVGGLLRAARGFDPSRGFRFTTYAAGGVRLALLNAGRAARRRVRALSLSAPGGEGRADFDPAAPVGREPPDLAAVVAAMRARVGEAAWGVLAMRHAEGMSREDIAARLGCTPNDVRLRLMSATNILRRSKELRAMAEEACNG